MKLVKKTDEYSVYLKRSGRYGVKNTDGKWINGVSKVRVLLAEDLVKTALPPEPEVVPDKPVDDTVDATPPDPAAIEDDGSKNNDPDAEDSETDEPGAEELANQESETSTEVEEEDSETEETTSLGDAEDVESSAASDTSDDAADTDTIDEEEPEAVEDPEAKEP